MGLFQSRRPCGIPHPAAAVASRPIPSRAPTAVPARDITREHGSRPGAGDLQPTPTVGSHAGARRYGRLGDTGETCPRSQPRHGAVRTTEAAALAAGRWMGRGRGRVADAAAVDAMRVVLQTVSMDGIVVIGEGEKDRAPMLFNGERIGDGSPPETDIADDPIEGTTLTALGGEAHSQSSRYPTGAPCSTRDPASTWRSSLSARRAGRGRLDQVTDRQHRGGGEGPRQSVLATYRRCPRPPEGMTAPAHRRGALEAERGSSSSSTATWEGRSRRRGRTQAWTSCWVSAGLPEGVLAATALKCMGGTIQGRLGRATTRSASRPSTPATTSRDPEHRHSGTRQNLFLSPTAGITDGELLEGVRYHDFGATTQSLVMRSLSGTVRFVTARHALQKLAEFSQIEFGCEPGA